MRDIVKHCFNFRKGVLHCNIATPLMIDVVFFEDIFDNDDWLVCLHIFCYFSIFLGKIYCFWIASQARKDGGLDCFVALLRSAPRKDGGFFLDSNGATVCDIICAMRQENKKGFVLWFTGVSASGKSTMADAVYN